VLLLFTTAQKGWSYLLTHAIVEAAEALGGSFKLVTLTIFTEATTTTIVHCYRSTEPQSVNSSLLKVQSSTDLQWPQPQPWSLILCLEFEQITRPLQQQQQQQQQQQTM